MNKNVWLILGVAAVAIALIVVLKPDLPYSEDAADGGDNGTSDETPFNGAPPTNFSFLMPEEWDYLNNAEKDIQTLTLGQDIRFGIVQDPIEPRVFYFGSVATDPKDSSQQLMSIYRYDTTNYNFERLYKKTYAAGDIEGIREGADYDFHVIAFDQMKLVVLLQDGSDSPGPCTEVYRLGREEDDIARELYSLDLADPYAKGLEPYRFPDEVYEEAAEKEEACLDKIF